MSKPRLVNLIVCGDLSIGRVLTLTDVRRRWRRPPPDFWVVADIDNPTGQPFSWALQLTHRQRLILDTPETLEIDTSSQIIVPQHIELAEAEPRIYQLHWLFDDQTAGKITLDFGHPEALP